VTDYLELLRAGVDISPSMGVPGWMSNAELLYLASVARRSRLIVEIGCWQGRSTVTLAANTSGTVYAVDPWKPYDELSAEYAAHPDEPDWVFKAFLWNTARYPNVHPIPMPSLAAAADFVRTSTKFDFIFIDAAHDEASVTADIEAWRPLLSTNGVLAGHDYDPEGFPGVSAAVNRLVPRFSVIDSIWTT